MPNESNNSSIPNSAVTHSRFGKGHVQADLGDSVIVRFTHGIEQCAREDLTPTLDAPAALSQSTYAPAGKTLLRLLAHAIQSCNDTWGVFSPSKIDLLPHQLWVCRKIHEGWPFRWLVADDVGLGKTIEAGLVLWPLIGRNLVKRLLILTPASLVGQWQQRMRQMFDIKLAVFHPEADTEKQAFWETHSMVAASLHTLRDDNKGRHERLLSSEKWDLILVDEAHHVNFDAQGGKTLNYLLLEQLLAPERADSVLFFTGTPHRGKHHNFFALLELLRPDLFDHSGDFTSQMPHLKEVMIRNNKQTVTDLHGEPLFKQPTVHSRTYTYTDQESAFYAKLTQFILSGRAYASSLSQSEGRAVILVLIVMQKLASSSVAAIRHTLSNRLKKIERATEQLSARNQIQEETDAGLSGSDEQNRIDEEKISQLMLQLMDHEQRALEELLEAASEVQTETKIVEILKYTRSLKPNQSVLFFTEYKATQSMLLSALMDEYGSDAVTFINGDTFLPQVSMPSGQPHDLRESREHAADSFNSGSKRFLVSTEAAGEGIDLQENCHCMVHVDLPWNPMRLHQRHGRLNRYGQKEVVEITLFRNPDTLEGQIWGMLSEKISNINASLAASMEEPEDLMPLILGMTPSSTFDSLYFDAPTKETSGLKEWFDAKTATLGGKDILETVRGMVGHAQKFDFKSISKQIPKLDLPDLLPFFEGMLRHHRKQIRRSDSALTFKTPASWAQAPGVTGLQENILFDRHPPKGSGWKVAGVGSPVVNQALAEAQGFDALVTVLEGEYCKHADLYVFTIEDKLTGSSGQVKQIVCGLLLEEESEPQFLNDAMLIDHLNRSLRHLPTARLLDPPAEPLKPKVTDRPDLESLEAVVSQNLPNLKLPFRMPDIRLIGVIRHA